MHGKDDQPKDCCKHDEPENKFTLFLKTYYPLILIFSYLILIIAITEWNDFKMMRAISHFMGAFFLTFSFFKFLDLKGFATAYQTYDLLAKKSRFYAHAYPFIELVLGIAYVAGFAPLYTNIVTFIVMSISSIGVIQSLLQKRKIQCACLGTIFKLPMTKITLFEDLLMAIMALVAVFGF